MPDKSKDPAQNLVEQALDIAAMTDLLFMFKKYCETYWDLFPSPANHAGSIYPQTECGLMSFARFPAFCLEAFPTWLQMIKARSWNWTDSRSRSWPAEMLEFHSFEQAWPFWDQMLCFHLKIEPDRPRKGVDK